MLHQPAIGSCMTDHDDQRLAAPRPKYPNAAISGSPPASLDGIKAVISWQEAPMVHPLTCGRDSNHRHLVPSVGFGHVQLMCLDCDYWQFVPLVVFSRWAALKAEADAQAGDL